MFALHISLLCLDALFFCAIDVLMQMRCMCNVALVASDPAHVSHTTCAFMRAAYFGFHSVIPADDERQYELDRWGIEPEDQWAVGKAFHDTIKTQMYSADPGMTPNITLVGGSSAFGYAQSVREAARPISQRDTAKPVVQDRPFNGPSPNR